MSTAAFIFTTYPGTYIKRCLTLDSVNLSCNLLMSNNSIMSLHCPGKGRGAVVVVVFYLVESIKLQIVHKSVKKQAFHASTEDNYHRCQPSRNRAFLHFHQNVPQFWQYFEIKKIAENLNNLAVRRHFVRKSSEITSVIASPSY